MAGVSVWLDLHLAVFHVYGDCGGRSYGTGIGFLVELQIVANEWVTGILGKLRGQ